MTGCMHRNGPIGDHHWSSVVGHRSLALLALLASVLELALALA